MYGGTERVVSYITEELVRQGHQVTLFASGDSETSAELGVCAERSLRLDPQVRDPLAHNVLMMENRARLRGQNARRPRLLLTRRDLRRAPRRWAAPR
ncbi:MAG: glycosyltransferase [Aeromicrobium sp.]